MREFEKYYPGPYRVDDSSGWGMLCGSYRFSEAQAAKIQDEFRDFIIDRLNS